MAEFTGEGHRPVPWPDYRPGSVRVATLAGNETLSMKSAQRQKLDPDGSNRDITLPGVGEGLENSDGMWYEFTNAANGAENLVIKNPAGSTVVTISQDEKATVVGTGAAAWDHMGIVDIALT